MPHRPTNSIPAPAHSEHPSQTQPRHYLYMFTYPRPQRCPPTTPYSIGQQPTGSPLWQAKSWLDGFSLTGDWLSLKASNSLYGWSRTKTRWTPVHSKRAAKHIETLLWKTRLPIKRLLSVFKWSRWRQQRQHRQGEMLVRTDSPISSRRALV